MMIKIINPLISKQEEIFNKLADGKSNEVTELEKKKVNRDDLVYRYKGKGPMKNLINMMMLQI